MNVKLSPSHDTKHPHRKDEKGNIHQRMEEVFKGVINGGYMHKKLDHGSDV